MRSKYFGMVLLLTIMLPPPALAASIPVPIITDINRPGPVPEFWWQQRHKANVLRANTKQPKSVFFGDSITDHWRDYGKEPWLARIAPMNALNFGIGGDRVQHLLWRIRNGEWGLMKPKIVFIMAGSNNVGAETPEDIAGWVQVLKDEIQRRSPHTTVVIFSVLPRGDKDRGIINRINQNLRLLDNGHNVMYKDISRHYLNHLGLIRTDLMPDRVHPNEKGYRIWADIIRGVIDKY